jgi:hypothetical protein
MYFSYKSITSKEKNMYGPVGGFGASTISVVALTAGAGADGTIASALPNAGGEAVIEAALIFAFVGVIVSAIAVIARIRTSKANTL